ncbi:MAG: hypothetical protein MI867_23330, partial [Pseudomonadales bacterium]|nr:hypothetical protein [Pseudomonadales bacterium]
GDTEKFSVSVTPECVTGSPRLDVNLQFTAVGDTQSTLELTNDELVRLTNGNLVLATSGQTTPFDPSQYTLTTKSGYVYQIDQNVGLRVVTDPNGHTLTYSDDGIVHSNGKRVDFLRDSEGRIEFLSDPKGQLTQYHYNDLGELSAVSDAIAYQTPEEDDVTYVYQTGHYLEDIIDPLGRRIVKNIYENGRLVAQEDGQGNRKDFNHDLNERSTIVTDRDGRQTLFNYDERGNVTDEIVVMSDGIYSSDIVTNYTYDANDNQETKTIGLSTWTTQYDASNNLTFAEDPEGNRVRYEEYNARGQETRIYDELDRLTVMDYDDNGNLDGITMPGLTNPDSGDVEQHQASNYILNGKVYSTTDLRGHVTSYTYYPSDHAWAGQKHTESSPLTGTITYTYDANNNVATETRQRTVNGAVVNETVEYEYDARDRVTRATYPDGTFTQTEYDIAGNMDRERDRFGEWTDYTYDEYGRLTLTEYPDQTTEVRTYTDEGLLDTVTDRMQRTTTYRYDGAGRLWRTIYPGGSFTETLYTLQGWVDSEQDEEGNITEYRYDLAGKRTQVIRTLDSRQIIHSYTYYDNGELHTETDANNNTTTYVINEFDQRIETQFANGTTMGQRFDPMGARVRMIDQETVGTDYRYDDLGRLEQVQPDVMIEGVRVPNTTYTYDEVGNKLTQTDANGHTTTWTYDYYGRVLTRTLPMGQVETYSYNDATREVTHTDFNGNYSITKQDNMGQVESVDYYFGDTDALRASESYTYYDNGQLHTVTDKHGTTTYGYDNRDRLDYLIQPDGVRFDYDYDNVGNRTEVTVTRNTDITTVTYTYDDLNRLKTVVNNEGTTEYEYYDNGNLYTVTYPNGVETEYQYNPVNQLEYMETTNEIGTVLSSFDYALYPSGRRDTITENNGRVTDYDYDDLYRLTNETITDSVNDDRSAEYQYDWVGNRTYSIVDGVHTSYVYDDNDRIETQGGYSYTYDDNGNTLTETIDGVVTTYVYDENNKLIETLTGGSTTSFTYNHNGIRTSKTEDGVTTEFVVDENRDYAQVLQEVVDGAEVVGYTYGHDLISQGRSGQVSYYQYDGLGSTRSLTDDAGAVTDRYNYEAFGEELAITDFTNATENSYRYTGEQYDASLDQYYLRARYYDQGVGRFSSMDTWAGIDNQPITLNKYLYANADPVIYVDPTGNYGALISLSFRGIATRTASTLMKRFYKELIITVGGAYVIDQNADNPLLANLNVQTSREEAKAQIQEEVEEASGESGLLFHYTDSAGAKGIEGSNCIRATGFFGHDPDGIPRPQGAYATDVTPWEHGFTQ